MALHLLAPLASLVVASALLLLAPLAPLVVASALLLWHPWHRWWW